MTFAGGQIYDGMWQAGEPAGAGAAATPAELATLQDAQWPVHVIGCIVAGQGVQLVDAAGNELPVSARGYNHFHA